MNPSDLLRLWHEGIRSVGPVDVDTETSGLYADDGARVSTVSCAFVIGGGNFLTWEYNYQVEEYAPGQFAPIASFAWPFDQGVDGKPEQKDQGALWADADNLPLEEWQALLEWLRLCGQESGLSWHNAKFDLEKMRVGVRRWPGVGYDFEPLTVWDTQITANLIWPRIEHPQTKKPTSSLKPLMSIFWGAETNEEAEKVKAYLRKSKLPAGRWDLIPWSIIGQYADEDARNTTKVRLREQFEIQQRMAGEWLDSPEDVLALAARRLDVMRVLYRMEWRGLPYDEVGSRLAADQCEQRAAILADQLPFAPPTLPKAKEFFFTDKPTSRGVPGLDRIPYSVTDGGGASMTAEIVGRMVADEVPYAEKWADYQKVTTAASMWYTAYADAMGSDLRLRTCFRQVAAGKEGDGGTRSSRFSVERVNLQAIPQDYRLSEFRAMDGIPTPRALIASAVEKMPGWKIYELDLAQAELRVGAMFAGCESMLEMIRTGEDLHSYTTQSLFPDIEVGGPQWGQYRQVGKRGNFSLLFGSGADTFRKMVSKETGIRLEEHEAMRIVRDWNGLYPEFREAIDYHMNKVVWRQTRFGYGWIDTVTGERRWFQRYEDAHKAFNQRVQTNLAQFGQSWMLKTEDYLHGLGLDDRGLECGVGRAGLLLTIHDSQVLLLPDDEEGQALADTCAGFGRDLWKEMFPGVPGDVDFHPW